MNDESKVSRPPPDCRFMLLLQKRGDVYKTVLPDGLVVTIEGEPGSLPRIAQFMAMSVELHRRKHELEAACARWNKLQDDLKYWEGEARGEQLKASKFEAALKDETRRANDLEAAAADAHKMAEHYLQQAQLSAAELQACRTLCGGLVQQPPNL